MKSVRIRSFSGPYFPAFGVNTEITDQKNSVYEHFTRSAMDASLMLNNPAQVRVLS